MSMAFSIGVPNFPQLGDTRRSYDVILIFQDGCHGVGNVLMVLVLVMALVKNVEIYLYTKFQ